MTASVRYTARRSLASGYGVDDVVYFDLPLRYAGLVASRSKVVFQHESLARYREGYHYAGGSVWSCSTIPVNAVLQAKMEMFLNSVEDVQVFKFSPSGGTAFVNATIDGDYTPIVDPALDSLKSYSFVIVEHP